MRIINGGTIARVVLSACLLLAHAAAAAAQDAAIVGVVADESKAVLPGVTVTAINTSTGREFMDVTASEGDYRLVGLPAGRYTLRADLPGFALTVVEGIELLVGQSATLGLGMQLATLNESITVSATSPLVDVRQAHVAGNVDARQMEAIPIAGRNWQQHQPGRDRTSHPRSVVARRQLERDARAEAQLLPLPLALRPGGRRALVAPISLSRAFARDAVQLSPELVRGLHDDALRPDLA